MRDRSVYRLPPRPRTTGWLLAGASAGSVLGIVELSMTWTDLQTPPPLGLAMLGITSVSIGAAAAVLGATLQRFRIRPSHSATIGAVLAPLLFANAAGAFASRSADAIPTTLGVVGLATTLGLAALVGAIAAHFGSRLERSGIVLSGVLLWSAVALPMAATQWALRPPPRPGRVSDSPPERSPM